nr:MAG TPA: hypothetical protein [Caudoviricetes sp.]
MWDIQQSTYLISQIIRYYFYTILINQQRPKDIIYITAYIPTFYSRDIRFTLIQPIKKTTLISLREFT